MPFLTDREWLTGFSKRKKAKVDERRAKAKARDHQEHLEERRKVCALAVEANTAKNRRD
jgi:ribosomal RNA-processing protein 17